MTMLAVCRKHDWLQSGNTQDTKHNDTWNHWVFLLQPNYRVHGLLPRRMETFLQCMALFISGSFPTFKSITAELLANNQSVVCHH